MATTIIDGWLRSDLDDPEAVYPELARRIAVALARRDAEIERLRSQAVVAAGQRSDDSGADPLVFDSKIS